MQIPSTISKFVKVFGFALVVAPARYGGWYCSIGPISNSKFTDMLDLENWGDSLWADFNFFLTDFEEGQAFPYSSGTDFNDALHQLEKKLASISDEQIEYGSPWAEEYNRLLGLLVDGDSINMWDFTKISK